MSSINININKTTKQVEFKIDDRVITEEMSEKIAEICNILFTDSNEFNEVNAFNKIYQYIKGYNRILYSQISNMVYAYFNEHTPEEAANALGTMISNIEKIVAYNGTQAYKDKKSKVKSLEDKKVFDDTEKALIKIWDHVNLAQTQYSGLKQTDDEYKRKFDKSITPFKEELVKDMNSQLLTMVSIFTALAFLIFGGISSLDNIFANQGIPIFKIMIIGSIWGLCILNMIFVFLFCVDKMTKLNFKSTEDRDATIFQKYPIIWWSNLVIISIMGLSMWAYYLTKKSIHTWFDKICFANPMLATIIGTSVIIIVIIFFTYKLVKATKYSSTKEE